MSADNQTAILLNNTVLVQAMTSDLTKVEGNWYFPDHVLVDRVRYSESKTKTHCGWKGDASYYDYTDDSGKTYQDIAWFYPTPMKGAEQVAGRVAFNLSKYPDLKVGAPPVK